MNVKTLIPTHIELKPGDKVVLSPGKRYAKTVTILKVVESEKGVYVVLSNRTWRPLTTHGITWMKISYI